MVTRRRFLHTGSLAAVAVAGLTGGAAGAPPPYETGQPPASSPSPPGTGPAPGPQVPAPLTLQPITAPTEREQEYAPAALPPDRRVGFAVVGLGRLSLEEILPAFGESTRCRATALVSGDRQKALRVAQQYGIKESSVYDYQTYDRLADNPDVEVIYIVLPNGMHAEYTIRGAKAGKHILCEKPMANTSREAAEMIQACRAANRKLMIAYRIQYEPFNTSVKKLVRASLESGKGELGKIKLLTMANGQSQGGDLKQWRLDKTLAGGGALPDIGIYCLNTARFLTGEEPIEISGAQVYSTPGDPRFREVEETVNWLMRFPSGVMANCSTSYGMHETRHYQVHASDAWAQMNPAFAYTGLRLQIGRKSPFDPRAEGIEERRLNQKNQFALEMDHMAMCVQENKTPYTPGEEGLQDHRLMEAIYESGRTGKTIKLPRVDKKDIFRGDPPKEAH
ncbi:MAG: Gfo/Idh/MocA family oxidoreductase [Cytophagales bacterium]|nr:Gfo/Idh/MocA family oxidoreductase [Armatimonadota bacterium]